MIFARKSEPTREERVLEQLTAAGVWWIYAGQGLSVLGDPLMYGLRMDETLVLVLDGSFQPIVEAVLQAFVDECPGKKGFVVGDRLIANGELIAYMQAQSREPSKL